MKVFYKHFKTKKSDYFLYVNWVNHNGFGKPILKINYKATSHAEHLFDFSFYKLHCYLVRSIDVNWNGDKPIKVNRK